MCVRALVFVCVCVSSWMLTRGKSLLRKMFSWPGKSSFLLTGLFCQDNKEKRKYATFKNLKLLKHMQAHVLMSFVLTACFSLT